jgi:protein-L-isoaspartate(D-aspartate) O-methyltransferase
MITTTGGHLAVESEPPPEGAAAHRIAAQRNDPVTGDVSREHWIVPVHGLTSTDPDGIVRAIARRDGTVWPVVRRSHHHADTPLRRDSPMPRRRLHPGNHAGATDADDTRTIGRHIQRIRHAQDKSLRVIAGLVTADPRTRQQTHRYGSVQRMTHVRRRSEMTGETSTVTDLAAELRGKLVDELCEWELFRTAAGENAMRTVPRHVFLPGIPVEEAYSHGNVVTHRDSEGVAVSSASAAGTVAGMLGQLEVRPGHRVLEIGAGTGYNAALLARLAGPQGQVTTVDIDAEVAKGARRNLNAAGYAGVQVICGDGEHGYPAAAPFDRIIVTAGAWDIPPAWLAQLASAGRIVVPLRIRGLTRSVALERYGPCWRSVSVENCGFIPLRGAGHQPERNIRLDQDGKLILRIDDGQSADADALRCAVGGTPVQLWTQTMVTSQETGTGFGDLDYFLAVPDGLCRLLTRSPDHGLVAPALAYGSMALLQGETLAYLTKRPEGEISRYELGVCTYGPAGEKLASQAAERIRAWDTGRTLATQIEVYPSGAPVPSPGTGTLLTAAKRHVQVVIRTVSPMNETHQR